MSEFTYQICFWLSLYLPIGSIILHYALHYQFPQAYGELTTQKKVIVHAAIFCFAFFVWPTPFRQVYMNGHQLKYVRTSSEFAGVNTPEGWVYNQHQTPTPSPPQPSPLPTSSQSPEQLNHIVSESMAFGEVVLECTTSENSPLKRQLCIMHNSPYKGKYQLKMPNGVLIANIPWNVSSEELTEKFVNYLTENNIDITQTVGGYNFENRCPSIEANTYGLQLGNGYCFIGIEEGTSPSIIKLAIKSYAAETWLAKNISEQP